MSEGSDNLLFSGVGTPPEKQDAKVKKPPPPYADRLFRYRPDEKARLEESKILEAKRKKRYSTKDSKRRAIFRHLKKEDPGFKEILDGMEKEMEEKDEKIETLEIKTQTLESELNEINQLLKTLRIEKRTEQNKWELKSMKTDDGNIGIFLPTKNHLNHFPALLAAVTPAATETGVVILRNVDHTWIPADSLPDGDCEALHYKLLTQEHPIDPSDYENWENTQVIHVHISEQEHPLAEAQKVLNEPVWLEEFTVFGAPSNQDIIIETEPERRLTNYYASEIPSMYLTFFNQYLFLFSSFIITSAPGIGIY